jgi:hypothetical protein
MGSVARHKGSSSNIFLVRIESKPLKVNHTNKTVLLALFIVKQKQKNVECAYISSIEPQRVPPPPPMKFRGPYKFMSKGVSTVSTEQ